jgi:hypothetical protein
MSTQIREVYIGYYEPGTTINIPVDFIKNNGPNIATGVQVAVNYPAELTYSSSALDQGSYSDITKIWTISTLLVAQEVGAIFMFDVVDDCPSTFSITFTVSTLTGCESCLNDNELCINTTGVSCCNSSGCDDDSIQTVTIASHTVLLTEETFLADATSNVIDFVLPSAAATYNSVTSKGKRFTFKVIEFSNGVTITSTEKIVDNTTIAGAGSVYTFSGVGVSVTLISDGSNYFII